MTSNLPINTVATELLILGGAVLQICRAYAAVEKIHFDGAHFRRDIAAKALS
jgi:hypothetical protein